MSEPIRFLAALAGQSTAARWLAVGADGTCKIVLECDSQQLGNVLKLATAGERLLHVTVEIE